MARVRNIEVEDVGGEARAVYERIQRDYGPFGNMLRVFAHRPPALRHVFGLLLESASDAVISKRHLEIVLLTASKAASCAYCVAHHAPRLAEHLPADTVERILEPDVPGLDPIDRLVRDYALQVPRDPARVSDALFAQLREHFSEEQVVELTLRTALCAFFNRFNEALGIEIEEDALALPLV
ncbi:putative peroxidase-related enzyme [Azospirillum agricola]|uniref:carboxymuconolactone decarboxylase family protein n=1 Tax=Azospirillum agricola TaxID=1720247 RepID=UPI001AE52676|nr:hypothetical protein [Azospirillum agricola]MBP2229196.1 putative peroxidase-related enzyme [Azospirillum agricola]